MTNRKRNPDIRVQLPEMHGNYVRQIAQELELPLSLVIRRGIERLMLTHPYTDNEQLNQQIADWIAKGNLV